MATVLVRVASVSQIRVQKAMVIGEAQERVRQSIMRLSSPASCTPGYKDWPCLLRCNILHSNMGLLVLLLLSTLLPLYSAQLYPFGEAVGDHVMPDLDDMVDGPIMIANCVFPFMGENITELYVSTNGVISMGETIDPVFGSNSFPHPNRLIAPFWADVDPRASGTLFHRESTDPVLLERARIDIITAYPEFPDVQPLCLFIATWEDVGYYRLRSDRVNTFQVVLISDNECTYVIFIYPRRGINWSICEGKGATTYAHVGINRGPGNYFSVPGSLTVDINDIDRRSNVGRRGIWIFKILDMIILPDPCRIGPCAGVAECQRHSLRSLTFDCICDPPFIGDGFESCEDPSSMGGDPHFSLVLPSKQLLCFSIMGEQGFSYNLISNSKLIMNALFTPDSKKEGVTWIGALGIIAKSPARVNQVEVTFTAMLPRITFNKAELLPENIGRITFRNGGAVIRDRTVALNSSSPEVLVVAEDAGLIFTVRWMREHLDLFWHDSSYQVEDSHGLLGQFFRKDVVVDEVREILLAPDREPVPVIKKRVWSFMERERRDQRICWAVLGRGFIESTTQDYVIESLLHGYFPTAANATFWRNER